VPRWPPLVQPHFRSGVKGTQIARTFPCVADMSTSENPKTKTSILLEIAQQGDLRSFAQLVRPMHEALYAYAYLMMGSVAEADDVLRSGLSIARASLKGIGERDFDVFALHHVREVALRLLRGRPWQPPFEGGVGGRLSRALEDGDGDAVATLMVPQLRALSVEERDAFVMIGILALGPRLVIAVAGVEDIVIEARLNRAIARLEELLGASEGDFEEEIAHDGQGEPWSIAGSWRRAGSFVLECAPRPEGSVEELLLATHRRIHVAQEPVRRREGANGDTAWLPDFRTSVVLVVVLIVGVLVGILVPRAGKHDHHLRFQFAAEGASEIALIGDFNDWRPDAAPMQFRSESGAWEVWITVPPGRYRYSFLVDGAVRMPDSLGGETVPDGRGAEVSVIHVPNPRALRQPGLR
jgi:DNA-directed RNA polymerase specialized sigma24 family protein